MRTIYLIAFAPTRDFIAASDASRCFVHRSTPLWRPQSSAGVTTAMSKSPHTAGSMTLVWTSHRQRPSIAMSGPRRRRETSSSARRGRRVMRRQGLRPDALPIRELASGWTLRWDRPPGISFTSGHGWAAGPPPRVTAASVHHGFPSVRHPAGGANRAPGRHRLKLLSRLRRRPPVRRLRPDGNGARACSPASRPSRSRRRLQPPSPRTGPGRRGRRSPRSA